MLQGTGLDGIARSSEECIELGHGATPNSVGEKPVVTDPHQTDGEDVEQEPPQELDRLQRRSARMVPMSAILPPGPPSSGAGLTAACAPCGN